MFIKKGSERVVTVASPSFQCRVAAHMTAHKHHLENRTNKKWLTPFFVFGRSHTPSRAQGLDRKNTIVGKCQGRLPHRLTSSLAR